MVFLVDWSNKDLILEAVKDSRSFTEVISKLGLNSYGSNQATLKKYLKIHNIDHSHINGIAVSTEKMKLRQQCTKEQILVENSKVGRSTLKSFLHKHKLLKYECDTCIIIDYSTGAPLWNNKEIVLQIDHINGVNNDNRIENLRWLCPNCHSQTATYAGRKTKELRTSIAKAAYERRNIKRREKRKKLAELNKVLISEGKTPFNLKQKQIHEFTCNGCGDIFKSHSKYAKNCSVKCSKVKALKNNIDLIKLENEVKIMPLTSVGKIYNKTDNTIRKWCKAFNITIPVREPGHWAKLKAGKLM